MNNSAEKVNTWEGANLANITPRSIGRCQKWNTLVFVCKFVGSVHSLVTLGAQNIQLMPAMTLAQRIEHDLKSDGGEYVIRNNEPSKKSGVWEAFGIVYDRNNVKLDYAASKSYNKVYTFKTGTGTTTISKHKCPVLASEVATAKVFFKKHIVTKQKKETMMAAAADYCATDMRLFESLSRLGLKALIQMALDI